MYFVGITFRYQNIPSVKPGKENVAIHYFTILTLTFKIEYTLQSVSKTVINIFKGPLLIVLKSIELLIRMWHGCKEALILLHWYPFGIMYVTHDWVYTLPICHWKWQCHFPLFASFANWIEASLPNNAMAWLQRLSHWKARWSMQGSQICKYNDFSLSFSVTNMLHDLKWDNIEDRRQTQRLVTLHKILHEEIAIPRHNFTSRPNHKGQANSQQAIQPDQLQSSP